MWQVSPSTSLRRALCVACHPISMHAGCTVHLHGLQPSAMFQHTSQRVAAQHPRGFVRTSKITEPAEDTEISMLSRVTTLPRELRISAKSRDPIARIKAHRNVPRSTSEGHLNRWQCFALALLNVHLQAKPQLTPGARSRRLGRLHKICG